jgi:hypothetical protein
MIESTLAIDLNNDNRSQELAEVIAPNRFVRGHYLTTLRYGSLLLVFTYTFNFRSIASEIMSIISANILYSAL